MLKILGISLSILIGLSYGLSYIIPATWIELFWEFIITFGVGFGAFSLICPKEKRNRITNRITAVTSILAFSLVMVGYWSTTLFSLTSFLFEGLLRGVIVMYVINCIVHLTYWVVKGKEM